MITIRLNKQTKNLSLRISRPTIKLYQTGRKGQSGAEGPQGPQGIQGVKGDTGSQGPQGLQGPKGTDGLQGPKGDDGEQGPQGPAGPKGDTGSPGTTEFDGLTDKPLAPAFTGLLVNNATDEEFPTDPAEYSIQPNPMTFAYRDDDGTLRAAPATELDHLVQKIQLDMIEEELFTDIQTGDTATLSSANTYSDTKLSKTTSDTITDGVNYTLGTSAGTRFGTATNQRLGFYNASPVIQQASTVDLGLMLSNIGLRASGSNYPVSTSGAVTLSGTTTLSGQTRFGSTVRTSSVTLTATTSQYQFANATTASFTITLPSTTTAGMLFTIKKVDNSANTVTVTSAGTPLIDGQTTYVLATQWKYATFISTTTAGTWYVIANN